MKRSTILIGCLFLSLAGTTSVMAGRLLTLCHRGQEISILDGTLQALGHLAHGDRIGGCVSRPDTGPIEQPE